MRRRSRRQLVREARGDRNQITWYQLQCLVFQARRIMEESAHPRSPLTFFLAMIAVLAAPPIEAKSYWAYVPDPPLLQPVTWSEADLPIFYNDSTFGRVLGNLPITNTSVNYSNWFNTPPVCLSPMSTNSGCVKAVALEHAISYQTTVNSQFFTHLRKNYKAVGSNICLPCKQTVSR